MIWQKNYEEYTRPSSSLLNYCYNWHLKLYYIIIYFIIIHFILLNKIEL
jgi:hypothetical protein